MIVTDDSISQTKEGAGVLIRTLKKSEETKRPKIGDSVLVQYECFLQNDQNVDTTRDRNQALQFELGTNHVIQGLEVAVQRMSVGQIVEVTIPHLYAYGHRGHPPQIPPKANLLFRLELLEIQEKKRGGKR